MRQKLVLEKSIYFIVYIKQIATNPNFYSSPLNTNNNLGTTSFQELCESHTLLKVLVLKRRKITKYLKR